MRDLLSSIVARSFGPVGSLRPRVRSVFEPLRAEATATGTQAGVATSDGRLGLVEVDQEQSTPASASVTSRGRWRRDPLSKERFDAEVYTEHSSPEASRGQLQGAQQPVTRIVSRELEAVREQISMRRPDTELRQPAQDSRAERNGELQRAVRSSNPLLDPSIAAAEIAIPVRSKPVERDLVVATRRTLQVAEEVKAMVPSNVTVAGNGHRAGESGPTPAAEPDVHITIGRVEVRAVSERQAPHSQRSVPPVVGLNEYLRSSAPRGAV